VTRTLLVLLCLAAAACAPAGTSAPSSPAAATATSVAPDTARPTTTSGAPPEGCASGYRVRSGSIVVRITEHIGPIPVHEAVMEGDVVSGGFAFEPAGRFSTCSAMTADLRRLRSTDSIPGEDVRKRDERVHGDFLETRRYPHAVLGLSAVTGIPHPLPARGEWNATITGELTLHGRTRPVEWSVRATRDEVSLGATATTSVVFEDFNIERPVQFLSLDERIRIEVRIQAELR
jgi:polyisoprenoid-binding protein YceI